MPLTADTLNSYVAHAFIETGTYRCEGIAVAYSLGFKQILTCDIVKRTVPLWSRFWYGDSKDVLEEMIKAADESITFWLDAHWCDHTDAPKMQCPLLDELDIIKKHCELPHTILIDDVSAMGKPKWFMPPLEEVVVSLIGYKIITKGDVLCCTAS